MTAAVDAYNVHSRPIRPLPKRRLRSRLSDDVRTALFAPAPTNPPRLFQPFGDTSLSWSSVTKAPLEVLSTGVHTDLSVDQLQESSDEEDNSLSSVAGNNGSSGTGPRPSGDTPGAGSTGGLLDSYDYTNNKKKRKIPSPANPGSIGGNITEGTNITLGSQPSGFSPNGPNTTPRSRWKSSTQRSPLGIASGSHTNIRRTPRRHPVSPLDGRRPAGRLFSQYGSDDTQSTTSSQNENACPSMDKGGIAAIHQSQFTFEHLTPASSSLAHQQPFPQQKTMSTVGTQTSPSISASNTYTPTPTPQKKKASRAAKQAQQQRQRRPFYPVQNPNGEIWICEFCEYESIFGERPEALMRQYDMKERKERRRLREKQRLLEKAKQKNKSNTGKSGKKAANSKHAASGNTPPPGPPPNTGDYHETPLPSTTAAPVSRAQRNSQQVQTEPEFTSQHISSGRGAGAGGGVGGGGGGKTSTGALTGGCPGGGVQGGSGA